MRTDGPAAAKMPATVSAKESAAPGGAAQYSQIVGERLSRSECRGSSGNSPAVLQDR
jgi:hypothetical protein